MAEDRGKPLSWNMRPLQGQWCRTRYAIWLNTAQKFFYILNTLFIRIVLSLLTAYRSAENIFSDRSYKGCHQTGTYAFQRIWEQRRPNLGAETTESGSRDERRWEQRRTRLGRHSPSNRESVFSRWQRFGQKWGVA